jgi:hypothetical protein
MVKSAAMFGGETWAVAEMDVTRLGSWEMQILRMIHGPVLAQGMWRI